MVIQPLNENMKTTDQQDEIEKLTRERDEVATICGKLFSIIAGAAEAAEHSKDPLDVYGQLSEACSKAFSEYECIGAIQFERDLSLAIRAAALRCEYSARVLVGNDPSQEDRLESKQ